MARVSEVEIPDFQGFSPEAYKFLRSLKRNNRRDWFQPRKEKFIELWQHPMMALIFELRDLMKTSAPEIQFDPVRSPLRIYRDTRFSKDKTPYKDFVAAKFAWGSYGRGVDSPGLYIHIDVEDVFLGGGIYTPNSEQLRKMRESLLRNPDKFLDVIEDKTFKKHFGEISGEKLKTNPRGVLPDHELLEYLKLKQFYVSVSLDLKGATRADFPKKVAAEFQEMMPLLRWINKSQSLW